MQSIDNKLSGHGIYKIKFDDDTEYYLYIKKTHKLSDSVIIELFLKSGNPDVKYVFRKLKTFKYIIEKHINDYKINSIILFFNDNDDSIINKKIRVFLKYVDLNKYEIVYNDAPNIIYYENNKKFIMIKKCVIVKTQTTF